MTMTTNGSGGTVPPVAATPAKGAATKAKAKRSKRHSPEQIVAKLRDAAAMLNAGKDMAAVVQALEVSLNFNTILVQQLELPRLEYAVEIDLDSLLTGDNELRLGFRTVEYPVDIGKKELFGFANYRIACDGFNRSDTIIPRYDGTHEIDMKFNWNPK